RFCGTTASTSARRTSSEVNAGRAVRGRDRAWKAAAVNRRFSFSRKIHGSDFWQPVGIPSGGGYAKSVNALGGRSIPHGRPGKEADATGGAGRSLGRNRT